MDWWQVVNLARWSFIDVRKASLAKVHFSPGLISTCQPTSVRIRERVGEAEEVSAGGTEAFSAVIGLTWCLSLGKDALKRRPH